MVELNPPKIGKATLANAEVTREGAQKITASDIRLHPDRRIDFPAQTNFRGGTS